MNIPTDLSPETAAWVHTQIATANARTAATLRAEINRVDDWANGLFAVFNDVLPYLLREHPELARKIAPQWSRAADDFDQIHLYGMPAKPNEPLEFLEARKMLYRLFDLLGVWSATEKKTLKSVPRARRA